MQFTDREGRAPGVGTYNRHALIAFRYLTETPRPKLTPTGLSASGAAMKPENASIRRVLSLGPFRIDGLPGLIMDRYGDAISVQLNTAGMDKLREPLFEAMDRLADVNTLVLRGDTRNENTKDWPRGGNPARRWH